MYPPETRNVPQALSVFKNRVLELMTARNDVPLVLTSRQSQRAWLVSFFEAPVMIRTKSR
jgi:hypothetical protein